MKKHHQKKDWDDQAFSDDPDGGSYRSKHHFVFVLATGFCIGIDLVSAICLCIFKFDTPVYLWFTAASVAFIESAYVGGATWMLETKRGAHSHWDLGKFAAMLWFAGFVIDFAFCWGALSGTGTAETSSLTMYIMIGLLIGRTSGGGLVTLMAWRLGILMLRNTAADRRSKKHGKGDEGSEASSAGSQKEPSSDGGDSGASGDEAKAKNRRRSKKGPRRDETTESDTS